MRFRTVAAFLWMPQLRMSAQPLADLWPLFVHMVACSFASCGLIDPYHPALTQHGQGVKLRALFAEALVNAGRSTAKPRAYAVLAAVFLMFLMVIGAAVNVSLMFVGSTPAMAQLFAHPLGDSSVDGYQRAADSFDMAVPPTGTAQGDYAIMLLDKVMRAGAAGKGVPLQNALRDVMVVYNSAMLIIASVIVFWLILSIVVDTARTGTVGGQRHNMVWAPIRIVFALGLLIPLGSAGFSSGQFMVMKLAEWGSNLGTNAWVAYVGGIVEGEQLVADYVPESATAYVKDLARIMVCSAAMNGQYIASGTDERMISIQRPTEMPNTYVREWRAPNGDSCGSMTLEHGLAYSEIATGSDGVSMAIQQFKTQMRAKYVATLLSAEPEVRKFACDFVATQAPYQVNERSMSDLAATPECMGKKNALLINPYDIKVDRLRDIVATVGAQIATDYNSGIAGLRNGKTGAALTDEMKMRGWAGMGAWYHRISQLNAAAAALTEAPVTVSGGNLYGMSSFHAADHARSVIKDFDGWWGASTLTAPAATIDPKSGKPSTTALQPATKQTGSEAILAGIMNAEPRNALNALVDATGITTTWVASLAAITGGANEKDVYPLAMLAWVGDNLAFTGVAINGIMLGLHAFMSLGSVQVFGVGINLTPLSNSYAFEVIPKIGMALIIAGMMLKFYIPLIPFVRVIFAVLTWIISVFEAVMLVPVAALAHLTTEGEGLAGQAKTAWILWLNILLRPVLTVIGFVGALLIFNAWVAFFSDNFLHSLAVGLPTKGFMGLLTCLSLAVVYVFVMYTAANTVFKLLDLIPNALMRWMGGQADTSFDNDNDRGVMLAAANLVTRAGGARAPKQPSDKKPPAEGAGLTSAASKKGGNDAT